MTGRFGLIGHPLTGSGSPALFSRFASSHGMTASYDLIDEPDFEKAWQVFLDEYEAVNVTAPFKTRACLRADILSPECEKTGAANILVKTPDGIRAYNSDYLGVLSLLRDRFPSLNPPGQCEFVEQMYTVRPASSMPGGSAALVVGCGGAGKAAACAALDAGFATVTLANRTLSAATQFSFDTARWYNGRIRLTSLDQIGECRYDLAVYALPCHIPQADDINAGVILEANYRTPCLAPEAGRPSGDVTHGTYIHGNEWLSAQAREGYPLMLGF